MPRGRGHRGNLIEIGTELNLVPYLDIMTVIVMFLLLTITSFLSFTMVNASIPQVAPDAPVPPQEQTKKDSLLLMIRVTDKGFEVDPSTQGGQSMQKISVAKTEAGYDYAKLQSVATEIKARFSGESRVLIIAEPKIIYDHIIHTMDSVREKTPGAADLFPDVTLSIL